MRKSVLGGRFAAGVLALGVLGGISSAAAAAEPSPAPVSRLLHVPRMPAPPVVDGVIGSNEWDGASAVTAMASYFETIVPAVQQIVLYLGYDDTHLYLRMYSPKPTNMVLQARCTTPDLEGGIIFDDHVEIQISNHGRENVMRPGLGFYKICANPIDTLSDLWYYSPTAGSEATWTSGLRLKSGVHDDRWDLEMAIPLKSILPAGVPPDNASFIFQFVRADTCGGLYFVGWAASDWRGWNKFPEVVLDPRAPPIQFTGAGDLQEGKLDVTIRVGPQATSPLKAKVTVLNKSGAAIFEEEQPARPGTVTSFRKDIPGLDATDNRFMVTVTAADGALELCQFNPIKKMTEDYRVKYLVPWQTQKAQPGDYRFHVAYWPYYNKIEALVDLNFFGIRQEILQAPRYRVVLVGPDGKELARHEGELQAKKASLVMSVPDLAPGSYTLRLALLDAQGNPVDESKTASLTRTRYPWEHNTLGTDRDVIPPYVPIRSASTTFTVWGPRDIRVGDGGLPESIVNQGETIVSAPMRLEASVNGQVTPWQPSTVKRTRKNDDRVEFRGTARVVDIPVTVDGFLEYDGWCQVAIRLDPATPVTVSNLDLVIPLWNGADTVDFMRGSYLDNNSRFAGAIPAGTGVVWESRSLAPCGEEWGSFVPQIFVGNGDKGLWVLAPNHEDWDLNDRQSVVRLERIDGTPRLRIRFLAGPVTLGKPRLLDLVFLPEPVKPLPKNWRAIAWAYPNAHYTHDTAGYRYYGAQVDGFVLPTDEEYVRLGEYLDGALKFTADEAQRPGPMLRRRVPGKPLVIYGSAWKTGMFDEFRTFGGEWLKNSLWVPAAEPGFDGSWNTTKSIQWTNVLQNSVVAVNWSRSMVDCYVWYYEKHLRLARFNGTWWDDGGLGVIRDWDERRQKFVDQWWFLARRQLTKRLNVVGVKLGLPPWWLINQHADFSWNQIGWHIEEIFYGQTRGRGYFGVLTPDQFRATTRSRGGIIPRLTPRAEQDLTKEEAAHFMRTAYGMCALHDIGAYMEGQQDEEAITFGRVPIEQNRIRMMLDVVGAYDEGGECIPYWRSKFLVHLRAEQEKNEQLRQMLVTVYRGRGKALLVIANPTGKPQEFVHWAWTIEEQLLGHPPVQFTDAETWQSLQFGVHVPAYDFRFILVE